MSFTNRLATIVPSFGTPLNNDTLYLKQNTTISADGTTSLTALVPSVRAGKFRFKLSNGAGTTPTLVSAVLQAYDGTNTVTCGVFNPPAAVAISSTGSVDIVFEFLLDISATQFNLVLDIGGTSPTFTLDIEVSGTTGNS